MRTLPLLLVSLLWAAPALCTPSGQPDTAREMHIIATSLAPVHALKGHEVRQSVAQKMLRDNIPGLSMAFVDEGQVRWAQSFGYADLQSLKKVSPETVFAGASLSKPLAAIAALRMVEQGRLTLDKDVNQYLKGWQVPDTELGKDEKVTLRRLITHRAGIKNELWESYSPGNAVPTLLQMLMGQAPSLDPPVQLETIPGTGHRYSNPGYSVIEKLIEDASDKSFEAALEALVLTPAGMQDSSFYQPVPDSLSTRRATGYSKALDPYQYKLFPFKAAGGIWSTPKDLARFVMLLMEDFHQGRGHLLSRTMIEQVFAFDDQRLGFSKRFPEDGSGLIFEHWGSNQGFTSYLVGSLYDKQALVVMTNSDKGFDLMAALARAVANYYDWPLIQTKQYSPVPVSEKTLSTFTGHYASPGHQEQQWQVKVQGGQLLMIEENAVTTELIPVGPRLFIDKTRNQTYEFLTDNKGHIGWVRVTQASGYNTDLPRTPKEQAAKG